MEVRHEVITAVAILDAGVASNAHEDDLVTGYMIRTITCWTLTATLEDSWACAACCRTDGSVDERKGTVVLTATTWASSSILARTRNLAGSALNAFSNLLVAVFDEKADPFETVAALRVRRVLLVLDAVLVGAGKTNAVRGGIEETEDGSSRKLVGDDAQKFDGAGVWLAVSLHGVSRVLRS